MFRIQLHLLLEKAKKKECGKEDVEGDDFVKKKGDRKVQDPQGE